MVADFGQAAVNPNILSEGLIRLLGEGQENSALEVILAAKENEGLAVRSDSASVNERLRASHESSVGQRDILIAYLTSKGIESKPVGNCPWLVSASLTPQQIYELAAEQGTPIEKIVPGRGLVKFYYGLGN